jgi:hypothetical protein
MELAWVPTIKATKPHKTSAARFIQSSLSALWRLRPNIARAEAGYVLFLRGQAQMATTKTANTKDTPNAKSSGLSKLDL